MCREVFIKDLKEGKVTVSGTIISKGKDSFVIDDKTGIVNVSGESEFDVNDYVRVFGVFLGEFVKSDVIQKLEGNFELHKSVKELLC
ncbi:MAG: hypothetical protein KJ674_01685 [Nanoarchaeota archaeon]|nr:hypothetical protein [Nanoarchaeota archaeon]